MCSEPDTPKLKTPAPIIPDAPPETTDVEIGLANDKDEGKNNKKVQRAKGARQLAIPLTSGSSGLGIP